MRKPQPQNWYDLSMGSSGYHISLTANTQKKRLGTEIYINDDKDMFEKFKAKKSQIEEALCIALEWITASKDCHILALTTGDIKKGETFWNGYFDWYCDMALRLREIAKKYDV